MYQRQWLFRLPAAALLACLCWGVAFDVLVQAQPLVSVFEKEAPESEYELRVIEKTAQDLGRKVAACTVGVEVGDAHGSGVIVSADGYVLTAAHVIGRPGRQAQIRLPDGRVAEGVTLGVHTVADGGLIKLDDAGPWPHVEMVGEDQGPRVGDWCLAAGHPDGFDGQRSPPLRLGRVIRVLPDVLQTDCPITGGDSGGPLFNMQGQVIGIHSRISEGVTDNFHGPVVAYRRAWNELASGEIYPVPPASRFLEALDVDGDGLLTRDELPADGLPRRVFDRLAEQFHLDPQKPHSIKQFAADVLQWKSSPRLRFTRMDVQRDEFDESLAEKLQVRGRVIRQLFVAVAADAARGTVRVESDEEWSGLGAVVSADGMIVTKASRLGDAVACRLPNGAKLPAQVVAVDKDHDLALLRVDAKNLAAVSWADADPAPGSWLVSPDADGDVVGLGVVSVAARKIRQAPALLGVMIENPDDGTKIRSVQERSGAAKAGIQAGDVIQRIMDETVVNMKQLRAALGEFRPGDVVRATVLREGATLELEVVLGAPEDVYFQFGTGRMNGPVSRRRDGFPTAIQEDAVLPPPLCGGPVVDLDGKVVGINIARASRIGGYIVPHEVVRSFVERHAADK